LSEAEASIAAPFTYSRPNISCIPFILAEGRSALITCFQLFRYMAMYSMIQFIAVILIYFKGMHAITNKPIQWEPTVDDIVDLE
jgi:magnesium-transporting ATPase (P-type)